MRGILLDRDGVINRERADYVKSWDEFEFLPGALAALRALASLDAPIAVITNQSVIGRGLVDRAVIDAIHTRLCATVRAAGGRIDAVFICPHAPADHCRCRKPQPGLLLDAAAHFGLTLAASIFVGDALTDYAAARAAGCRPLLVRSGRKRDEVTAFAATTPGVMAADDLAAAVACIRHLWAVIDLT